MNIDIQSSFLSWAECQVLTLGISTWTCKSNLRNLGSENEGVLLDTARCLDIPTTYSLSPSKNCRPLDGLGQYEQVFYRRRLQSFCSFEFREQLSNYKRNKLVLLGNDVELLLCVNALDALVEGFDVHIVVDAHPSVNTFAEQTTFRRLEQSGAVLVTTRQVIGEWIESCEDQSTLKRATKIVPSEYKDIHQLLEIRLSC